MIDKGTERLAGELRRWAGRPTELSPRAAGARVVARLPRRRRPVWRLATASTALAAAVLALSLVVGRRDEPAGNPPPPISQTTLRTIVHQLESGTKLYIVVQPNGPDDEC